MKSKALVSFAEGAEFINLLKVALPSFYNYANAHVYDLIIPSHKYILDVCNKYGWKYGERPASWMKVPILKNLLQSYDIVLWVDADIVITKSDIDIAENFINSDYMQAFVTHNVSEEFVPNMGVWLLNNKADDLLDKIWNKNECINHCWWEQQANMTVMNWKKHKKDQDDLTTYGKMAMELPYEWNVHKNDVRYNLESKNGRFMHSTMWPDRLRIMKEWACQVL